MKYAEKEILRYLGHRGQPVDGTTEKLIEKAVFECRKISKPLYRAAVFNARDGQFENCPVKLEGDAVKKYLSGARKACIMAATLGAEIEREISRREYKDMTYSVILDAAATQFIEEFCDKAQAEIEEKLKGENLYGKPRFSPGYGDLPISLQPQFLEAAGARGIGLYCTENFILTPRKSVTAIIGFFEKEQNTVVNNCLGCNMRGECDYGTPPEPTVLSEKI